MDNSRRACIFAGSIASIFMTQAHSQNNEAASATSNIAVSISTPSGSCVATTQDQRGAYVLSGDGIVHLAGANLAPGSDGDGSACQSLTGVITNFKIPLSLSTSSVQIGSPPVPASIYVYSQQNYSLSNMTCVGSLMKGGASITSGWVGWTQPFTLSSGGELSQSVSIPNTITAGIYTFKLSCSNGSISAMDDPDHPGILSATGSGGGGDTGSCLSTIPANDQRLAGVQDKSARVRLISADVQYGAVPQGTRYGVLFSEYSNLWGFSDSNASPPGVSWPGIGGSSPGFMMARNGYFGAHFRTPSSAPSQTSSYYTYPTYGTTDPISVSLSEKCGDFAGDPTVNACYKNNVPNDDGGSLNWIYDQSGSQGISKYFCYLKPNKDYYLNMMFTSTSPLPNPKCTAASTTGLCRIRYIRR